MVTSAQATKKYGNPETELWMEVWDVPSYLEIGVIPKRIYCNKDLIEPLKKAFESLIKTGCVKELKTWDGCFNIRKKRGLKALSLHSWGIAIDVNAAWNPLGGSSSLSSTFVKCFKDAGFDWGGDWTGRPDPMHFQLSKI
jgi:hypothetical protein